MVMWCGSKGCSRDRWSCWTGAALTRFISFGDDHQLHYKFGNPWVFLFLLPSSSSQTWMGWRNETRCNHAINLTSFFTHNQPWFASLTGLMLKAVQHQLPAVCYYILLSESQTRVRREVTRKWFGRFRCCKRCVGGRPLLFLWLARPGHLVDCKFVQRHLPLL